MADVFPSTLSEIYQDPKFLSELKVYKALQSSLPEDAKIYCQCHFFKTGYDGNKTDGDEFFTGKIRRQFPFWLDTEKFQFMIKSYSPCKIQHGGLGAFYVKLKSKE